jgi:hypothetical protein
MYSVDVISKEGLVGTEIFTAANRASGVALGKQIALRILERQLCITKCKGIVYADGQVIARFNLAPGGQR